MNIFTGFIPPTYCKPPTYIEHTEAYGKLSGMKIQESSGPETLSKRETYLQRHTSEELSQTLENTTCLQ